MPLETSVEQHFLDKQKANDTTHCETHIDFIFHPSSKSTTEMLMKA